MIYDVAIIGGGPAGCIAAVEAGKRGKNAVLLEANGKIGRKLLITGKGRCNLTNNSSPNEIIKNTVSNPKFLYSAVNEFTPTDLMEWFISLGVELKTERGNRVFPVSDRSSDIVDALFSQVRKYSKVLYGFRVNSLEKTDDKFIIISEKGDRVEAEKVILATGGKSYPLTGSRGDGYTFAQKLGHTVTTISPSLVPVICNEDYVGQMKGLSLRNVTLSLYEKDKKKPVFTELGEMLFTDCGISGPLALSASCHIKNDPSDYKIIIDLKPGLSFDELDTRILKDFSKNINRNFSNSLDELLPSSIIPVVINKSGIPQETKVNSITKPQRDTLLKAVKCFDLTVKSLGKIDEAIITRGGISVKEINPNTMESKLVPGLYFAGEIIDCDAYTGGFNLQIAFSTGHLAGNNV